MKRYVAVPKKECTDGSVPLHIMDFAKNNLLEIIVSEEYDKIEIVSAPEIKVYEYDKEVKVNYIWKFDMTNEFVDIGDDVHINFGELIIKPIIKEKHKVYFRTRFKNSEIINFKLINNNQIIYEGNTQVTL